MRLFKKPAVPVEDDAHYWVSFTDLMSSLLIIFILASVVLVVQSIQIQQQLKQQHQEFNEEIDALKKAEQVRRSLLQEMAETLEERGIRVHVSENDAVLSIPNEILGFDTAKYEIGEEYSATALEIGRVLGIVIRKDNRIEYLDTIFVEGHTDRRPFDGLMGMGNWGLSTFRAISLWELWRKRLPEAYQLVEMENRDGQKLFSVSGYADAREKIKNPRSEEDHKVNRRIDIRFTIRRPDSMEYQKISEKLEEEWH